MCRAILLFLLGWSYTLSAQLNGTYTFKQIDQSDGLLYTYVKGIGQDARGFIWILTLNGLQRYDGSRFVNYPNVIRQSSYGVMHDSELYVDTLHHQIRVLKGNQIEVLDISENTITTLTLKEVLEKDTLHKAQLFTEENQDKWLIGEMGSISYEKSTSKEKGSFFNINPAQSNRSTMIMKEPGSGNIWLHKFQHFMIADPRSKKIYATSDLHPEHPLLVQLSKQYGNTNRFRYIMEDSYHNVWISTWTDRLHRYNMDDQILYTYSLKEIKKKQEDPNPSDITILVNAFYEDRQKNIWFATDFAGLLRYNREKDDFDYITSDDKIRNGLRYSYGITSIFQDREDNIWLGTDRGISIFNPYRNYFQSIRHIDGKNTTLPKHDIIDVIETMEGEIWIATWGGGISVYDRNWNFIRNIQFQGPIEHNLVWSFVQHDDGTIWAGAQKGFIHIYNPVSHSFTTIQPGETNYSTIRTMVRDRNGNILMGLQNGKIAVWKKEDKKFYPYEDAVTQIKLPYDGVVDLFVDKSNQCWVSTASGLQKFDVEKRIYTHLFLPGHADSISNITVQGIEEYNDSVLMIGTTFHGMYFFNKISQSFYRSTMDSGLNETSVYAIKKDDRDNIWFTTDYHVYKVIPGNTQPTRFLMGHTMINAAFSAPRFYTMSDGRWITMTPAELICFHPGKIGEEAFDKLHVQFSGFKVNNELINIDSLLESKLPIRLSHRKNFITIEFSALDFTAVRQTNYSYRMSGVDDDWISAGSKQFADYTDLKPGSYTFEVRANQGDGTSPITSLEIVITPPWWGTLWFRILWVLALGALVYLIWKNRIQTIKKESQLKHRIAETEMMALRSQMNPHFIFNCINGIDAMIQSNDKYRATMYLNKFAKLIRNVLDISKQNKVPLSKDIETLQLYIDLELFRHPDKFTATIQVEEGLMQDDYTVPPLIIQPYVENAILHGLRHRNTQGGKLSVTVSKNAEHILYSIEDNGVGRKVNGSLLSDEVGYGMQMSNDRIRLFNEEEVASVNITDLKSEGQPAGTRIQVQLKIQ